METPCSNKHTLGKHYRKLKSLRKMDPKAEIKNLLSADISKYIEILTSKGIEIHHGLKLATFYTKNCLPYTGIITQNKLFPNEVLMKIPRGLLLTTKMAYFSEIKDVFDENPEFYSRYVEHNWEDNMLLTFLLYEYQKKNLSHWHFFIKSLPRDIDYLAFWKEEELDLLEDPYLKKKAKALLNEFETNYKKLCEIMEKYPNLFFKETYSYENVKWLHIHLITRSFGGRYLKYVTMVPFAEFFNHECTNVYYDFMGEKIEHINSKEDTQSNENYDQNWEEALSTSNESNKSEESFDSRDFEDINPNDLNLGNQIESDHFLDKQLLENEKMARNFREIIEWVLNTLDLGDVISFSYFNQVLIKLKFLKEQIFSKKNLKNNDIKEFERGFSALQTLNVNYKFHLLQYMSENKGIDPESEMKLTQKNIFLEDLKQNNTQNIQKKPFSDPSLWPDDDFDYMILKNSEHDCFEENSQVYFCYGRLSNRKLLTRYGLALEHNKYNHVFIKVSIFENLKNLAYDLVKYFNNFKLSKQKIFKLQATKFNLDFLLFAKGIFWQMEKNSIEELFEPFNIDLEIQGLLLMKKIIEKQLSERFENEIKKDNFEIIYQKNLNYHEHFSAIYRLERKRILILHTKNIDVSIAILSKIKKGETMKMAAKKVEGLEDEDEWQRNRFFLKSYLDRFNN